MTPDEFRRHGREVIDWIADYMERVPQLPVLAQVAPGDVRSRLPEHPPRQGEPFDAILKDVSEIILPGITHWQSPNFFAYFPSNNSGPSVLGELLSAGLGVQGMLWATSPACTELETHVLDWLVEAMGLPEQFRSTGAGGGVLQDSASSATLCAILAARERVKTACQAGKPDVLIAYASTQAHSSIEKGLRIAGLGSDSFRRSEVDHEQAMRPDRLAAAMEADIAAGRRPFFVCATAGTTSSLAFDPLRAIGEICRRHNVWLHVDAAMAGTAAICPEFRAMLDGLELADSYCFNPHKWMFTNFDCSCSYVADRGSLIGALSIMPEYLKNQATQSGQVIDYRDWQIPLGRRFRALKLWFVLRWFGIEGIQQIVRQHVALARELAGWIAADARFELAAPVHLNLVCFRHRAGDEATQRILDRVNASGKLLISHTRLDGRLTLRFCVGQTNTERRHVAAAWREIRGEADVQFSIKSIASNDPVDRIQAQQFGIGLCKDPVAYRLYAEITRQGITANLDFGQIIDTSEGVSAGNYEPASITVYVHAHSTVAEMVGTFAHEARHVIDAFRRLQQYTRWSEYRAFLQDFMVRYSRFPTDAEAARIAANVNRCYPHYAPDPLLSTIELSGHGTSK